MQTELGQALGVAAADPLEVGDRLVGPEIATVLLLVHGSDPDPVLVGRDPFGHDVHGDLGQVEVIPNPCGGRDLGLGLDHLDDLLGEIVGGRVVADQVAGDVHHNLIDRVGMDLGRWQVTEVNLVDLGTALEVEGHPGWDHLVFDLEAGGTEKFVPVD